MFDLPGPSGSPGPHDSPGPAGYPDSPVPLISLVPPNPPGFQWARLFVRN